MMWRRAGVIVLMLLWAAGARAGVSSSIALSPASKTAAVLLCYDLDAGLLAGCACLRGNRGFWDLPVEKRADVASGQPTPHRHNDETWIGPHYQVDYGGYGFNDPAMAGKDDLGQVNYLKFGPYGRLKLPNQPEPIVFHVWRLQR